MATNRKDYMRAYYDSHKEKIQAQQRAHYKKKKMQQANPWLLDLRVDFTTPTREDFKSIGQPELTYSQRYYAANKEKIRAQQKAIREKKKRQEYQREYYKANKDKIRAQQRASYAKKHKKSFFSKVISKFKSLFK